MTAHSLSRLEALLGIVSPSMQEERMTQHLSREWKAVAPGAQTRFDAIGNLEFSLVKGDSCPTLALVAHADTICVQITHPAGEGKFRFRPVGPSPHMLLGQPLLILTDRGEEIDAMVGFDATSQFGQPKGLVFEDLWIDVLDSNKVPLISPGDLAVLKPRHTIAGDHISSTSLDDRIGLFIIGEVIRRVVEEKIAVNLLCVASVQEEVGLRGSSSFEFSRRPDAVIILDVDYATDIPTPHEDQMGRLYLDAGPGLQRKADNSPALRRAIQEVARANNLPVQISLGRFLYGGTDSSTLQATRTPGGYATANISIPCRYMHSPVESVSLKDVETAIDLIVKFAAGL